MEEKSRKGVKVMALMTGLLVGLAFLQVIIALFQMVLILFKL